jgi:hypothetical protein
MYPTTEFEHSQQHLKKAALPHFGKPLKLQTLVAKERKKNAFILYNNRETSHIPMGMFNTPPKKKNILNTLRVSPGRCIHGSRWENSVPTPLTEQPPILSLSFPQQTFCWKACATADHSPVVCLVRQTDRQTDSSSYVLYWLIK